jgi:hypothetical protein
MFEIGPAAFRLCVGMVHGINKLSGFPLLSIDGR